MYKLVFENIVQSESLIYVIFYSLYFMKWLYNVTFLNPKFTQDASIIYYYLFQTFYLLYNDTKKSLETLNKWFMYLDFLEFFLFNMCLSASISVWYMHFWCLQTPKEC